MLEANPDEALAYGLFSRRQALAAGVEAKEIARRLRTGRWRRLEFGIYEEVGRSARPGDRVVRGVLRAGPRAVASHLTAASALSWDLLKEPPPLQFTVRRSNSTATSDGATLFRRDLRPDEVRLVGVLPVTAAARTAVDLAGDVDVLDAVVAVDSALRRRQLTLVAIQQVARDRATVPQHRRVLRVVGLLDPGAGSPPESVARVLFRDAGLPLPRTQFVVLSEHGTFLARVDFAWPEFLLVVEIDGFAWHSSEDAFQSDRDRQNDLELAGWTVLRFTAKDVRDRPAKVSATVAQALRATGC